MPYYQLSYFTVFGDTPAKAVIVVSGAGLFDALALVFSNYAAGDFVTSIVLEV